MFPVHKNSIIVCLILSFNFIFGAPPLHSQIPEESFSVKDFGASGNGVTKDTESIQRAIDAAHENGGGTVFFPAGTYLSGTIFLKNNVSLYLPAGAILLGSTDLKDFPEMIPNVRSYTDIYVKHSLIYAENIENVSLRGEGTIDGQGAAYTDKSWLIRPYLFRFVSSRHIKVEGLTLRNSPMWLQHYLACDFVTLRGLKIFNQVNHNNDMIDIDCSKNVFIADCYGDTGDDCITLKSTTNMITENVTITNCIVSSTCNGIKLGTESNGGFKNITISNCVINSKRMEPAILKRTTGISGISLEMVDGGILEKVVISNITMYGIDVPIFLRLGNRARPYKPGMKKPGMGTFRDVIISGITAEASDKIGCSITGLPGHPVENVILRDIVLRYPGGGAPEDAGREVPEFPEKYPEAFMFGTLPAFGFYCRHVEGLTFENVRTTTASGEERPAFVMDDVADLNMSSCGLLKPEPGMPFMVFKNVRTALISGCTAPKDARPFIHIEPGCSEINVIGNDLSRTPTPFGYSGADAKSALFETANKPYIP